LLGSVVLPLIADQTVLKHIGKVDSETALRYTMYGWPVAMLAVFGIFISPGGLTRGHLFHLEGAEICLAGFCGISGFLAAAVFLEVLIAIFGPGILGLLLVSRRRDVRG